MCGRFDFVVILVITLRFLAQVSPVPPILARYLTMLAIPCPFCSESGGIGGNAFLLAWPRQSKMARNRWLQHQNPLEVGTGPSSGRQRDFDCSSGWQAWVLLAHCYVAFHAMPQGAS